MKHVRYFRIGDQWNVLYLPEQPSGFAVCLIGDNGMTVTSNSSEWQQHPEKEQFIQDLLKRGYTVFASSLYDKHWGSPKAFELLENLYHLTLKREILNKKIHLFAEGTGGLLALKWISSQPGQIRSCYLVNPCLSLSSYYEQERENKLYYKRFVKELELAYNLNSERDIHEKWVRNQVPALTCGQCPPLSIHCHVQEKRFPLQTHSRALQKQLAADGCLINLRIHSNERSFYKEAQSAFPFYQKYEEVL